VVDLGRTTLEGTGHDLLADQRVRDAYLGES
jgi:branched-chain amino acid transport system ATP-binding protein